MESQSRLQRSIPGGRSTFTRQKKRDFSRQKRGKTEGGKNNFPAKFQKASTTFRQIYLTIYRLLGIFRSWEKSVSNNYLKQLLSRKETGEEEEEEKKGVAKTLFTQSSRKMTSKKMALMSTAKARRESVINFIFKKWVKCNKLYKNN